MEKKEAIEFLDGLAKGISSMFGQQCETLIHDMSVPKHPIVKIYNGHVTDRTVGSTKDVYGNEAGEEEVFLNQDFVNHLVTTHSGRKIKSSTFHYKGQAYHYALGINYDFTHIYTFSKIQYDFMKVDTDLDLAITELDENRLSILFDTCLLKIGKSVDAMNRSDRIQLLRLLQQEKAFNFKKFVPYVSERLNMSRYTIYKYIKEIEQ
ncbi:Predicted transcriptional regulator YheO, contains PAS and DNA-binding HTH domains [Amphibacillus marinus]|uniref:Predicted transcriptional regulator YheO, contains PAS and DNA-binding HTH domains n=1 Tax=Amphibacillus marinus TaxID=872970 RepID=A0A1H8M6F0_9BACI|nr:helix-turn-helix transcriptional regulator [Amphibacillus marinus]SEO12830.1 Predicted transcriptional regulator YheO, contains PAS and DNA-binding HTH domains [Amphibacillus marinus]